MEKSGRAESPRRESAWNLAGKSAYSGFVRDILWLSGKVCADFRENMGWIGALSDALYLVVHGSVFRQNLQAQAKRRYQMLCR
ncbi:hypothetical protein [Gemmobacter serpentinus]|uniref:hypothetical protein n=1 Tax=Gemmobacter serpentinus TaxID=2652247 RepID=UPI00124ED582|nr:hypothetical protein [Gemmobacter serpentinus]